MLEEPAILQSLKPSTARLHIETAMIMNRGLSKSTVAEIKSLEALLTYKPEDLKSRQCLMCLYHCWLTLNWLEQIVRKIFGKDKFVSKPRARLHFHAKWIIENAPDSSVSNYLKTFSFDYGSPKFYKECKQLWLELLDKKAGDSRLLENAALFFSRSDVELAEKLLLQALEIEPESAIFAEELDYVQARQTSDPKRMLQNRIRYFQRIIAEAPTPRTVASFTKLLEEYEDKFEKLSRESP